ncbi:MAG: ACT domain-containing protein [Eubacteriales bacterium]|nr:ACT domain-containing protein [Eubacteriales bacterium]
MKSRYYVVKEKALPEVLLKVVEAKKLLATRSDLSILDAAEQVGISRSSFYKYKDDIFPFYDNSKGKTVTFMIELDDSPGHLSEVLERIAEYRANILTIHQSIPVNNVAVLTLSVEIREDTKDISEMVGEIETFNFVYDMKIVSRE